MSKNKQWGHHTHNGVFMALGCVISGSISWAMWQSVAWCILHAILGWCYLMYWLLVYVNWAKALEILRAAGVVK